MRLKALGGLFLFLGCAQVLASDPSVLTTQNIELRGVSPYEMIENFLYVARTGTYTAGGWVDTQAGFKAIDVTVNADDESNLANAVFLEVQSIATFAPTANQHVIAVLETKVNSSTNEWRAVPIHAAGTGQVTPAICNSSTCQATLYFNSSIAAGRSTPTLSTSTEPVPIGTPIPVTTETQRVPAPFFAARFSPSAKILRIGFYPKDICWLFRQFGSATYPSGCTAPSGAGSATVPDYAVDTSTSLTRFNLRVSLYISAAADTYVPAFGSTHYSSEFTLTLQADSPTSSCSINEDDTYFPSDSAILYNTNALDHAPVSSGAPLQGAVIVAAPGATAGAVDTTETGYRSNPVYQVVDYASGSQSIGGFTNSTSASDLVPYSVAVSARDAAGFVSDDFCITHPVYAMKINTFLDRGKCFIATAAYRDPNAPQVRMLRQFRDRVLMKSSWGRAFIEFYYKHSPAAAEWLLEHPAFRIPVLILLAPVRAIAWLAMQWFGENEAHAAESQQPYIDRLRETMTEAESAESYTERERLQLEKKPRASPEGYSERIKRSLEEKEEVVDPQNAASYSDSEKSKLSIQEPSDDDLPESSIRAVSEGKSDLKLKRPGSIHHAVGFRTGGTTQFAMTGGAAGVSFFDIYERSWAPNFAFFYEYQPFHSEWLGNIGFTGSLGISFYSGTGRFAAEVPKPSGSGSFSQDSQTKLNFKVIPVSLGVNYRFNLLRVLRPFVGVAGTAIGFMESRDDDRAGINTYSLGYQFNAGVALLLDFLSRKSAWNYYDDFGFKHAYFTVEYMRLSTISGDVDLDSSGLYGGFTFEL